MTKPLTNRSRALAGLAAALALTLTLSPLRANADVAADATNPDVPSTVVDGTASADQADAGAIGQGTAARPVLRAPVSGRFSTDDGQPIYLNANGARVTGVGWHQIGGAWYYAVDSAGHLATGWKKLSNRWYWLDPTDNGRAVTGWNKVNGTWYYFADNCAMATGWLDYKDARYYLASNGSMATGWAKIDGAWYYFDPIHGNMATGVFTVKDKAYPASESGSVPLSSWVKVDGAWYLTDSTGAVRTGWVKPKTTWFWLDPADNGKMAVGPTEVNGKWYLFRDNGAMAVGWTKYDGTWYYATSSGALATGWNKINGTWYYLDPDTKQMLIGFFEVKGEKYVASDSGAVPISGWVTYDGGYYLTDEHGAVRTGWAQVNGSWYWLDAAADGKRVTGWKNPNGYWYYFLDNGVMTTGWIKFEGKSYYLDKNGRMVRNQWVGNRYLGSDGAMLTNTTTPDGKYVGEDGVYKASQLNGIDISAWQPNLDPSAIEGDFIIVKATGGDSYRSSVFTKQADATLESGKLLGLYHYAGDGKKGTTALSEAKWFVENVRPYAGRAILFLDWESGGNSAWTQNQLEVIWCKTFLDYVKQELGGTPMIYMSKSVTREYTRDWSSVAADYPLWVAQYAYSPDSWHPSYLSDPWTDKGGTGAWKEPTIYQYASGGRLDGYSGNLDLDLFYGTRDDWLSYQK